MFGYIKHALLLATVLLSGCVSYSQHELTAAGTWPPAAHMQQSSQRIKSNPFVTRFHRRFRNPAKS